jgi:hypothetical protein
MSLLCAFGQIVVNELWLLRIRLLARKEAVEMDEAVVVRPPPRPKETLNEKISRWTGIKRLSDEEFEVLRIEKEAEEAREAEAKRLAEEGPSEAR